MAAELSPPTPPESDLARWDETRARRRMLYGVWRNDVVGRLKTLIGDIRRDAWGEPDLSSNVLRTSVTALAVLYDQPPDVTWRQTEASKAESAGAEELIRMVRQSGLWSLMQRVQRDTLGMREMLVRVDAKMDGDEVRLMFRPVYPDLVVAQPSDDDPAAPVEVREARMRSVEGKDQWTWDVWTTAGDGSVVVQTADGADITALAVGTDSYAVTDDGGHAMLPYVLYHAANTGCLWDPWEGMELREGSLNVAVLWTFFTHCVRNASWPQRYAANVRVQSREVTGTEDTTRRGKVVTDPATVLLLETLDGDGGQPLIGQWQPGADPATLQDAIGMYERRIAAFAGISPSDVQRVAGDPRSGFAIALNREAQRQAQRRFEPVFRPADEALLATAAAVANSALEAAGHARRFPEGAYSVKYVGLPPSPEERQSEREYFAGLLEAQLTDPVTAYREMHPGLTEEQARDELLQSRLTTLELEQDVATAAAKAGLKASTKDEKQALVVAIARGIIVDAGMTPEAKRVALVALGGLDETTADALVRAQGLGPKRTME